METLKQDKMLEEEKEELKSEKGAASLTSVTPAFGRLSLGAFGSNQNQVDWEGAARTRKVAEATTVFQLLPEIWDSMFPHLKPSDFQAIINSCPRWRSLFESDKSDKLLPLWLPILLKKAGIREASALLSWRGVNKAAKSVVDNFLEDSSSAQTYHHNLGISSRWTTDVGNAEEELRLVAEKIKTRYEFTQRSQIQQLLDHMNSTSSVTLAQPFLTKSLVLKMGGSEVIPYNFRPNQLTFSLLQQYGNPVSFITIERPFVDIPFLFSILSQLPNLKVLVVKSFLPSPAQENIARWMSQVNLDQLELLDVRHVLPDSGLLLAPLLRCIGSQLQRLVCNGDLFMVEANLRTLHRGEYPNLRSLRVDLVNWEVLNRIGHLDLPLQEIELVGRRDRCRHSYLPFLIVNNQYIRRFANTLVHLKLCLKLDQILDEYYDLIVEFPHLSRFTTNLGNIFTSWFQNFIRRQAQRLTELNFVFEGRNRDPSSRRPGPEVIAKLQKIFESVPNLEKINVFCGFDLVFPENDEQTAEKIVIERNGLIRRSPFKLFDV